MTGFAQKGSVMDSAVLTTNLPLQLSEKFDQIAARLDQSREWVFEQALTDWIARDDERRQLTLEALASVDAGHFVGHRAVQAWAASLGTDHESPLPR